METQPVPTVIVTASADPSNVSNAFRVLDAGAVAILETPRGIHHPDHPAMAERLIRTVKLMSEIRVIKRSRRPAGEVRAKAPASAGELAKQHFELLAIGASTGGPPVLHTILNGLKKAPVPILMVQHIAAGFVQGLVDWLDQATGIEVKLARHGDRPLPGHAYLAPDGAHLQMGRFGRIELSSAPPDNGVRPAVSHLFRSVADVFGERAIGVLLTGMGRDGAEDLKRMRARGAVTIAQDESSSIVFGMPGHAVKIDGATYVLPPADIVATLNTLLGNSTPA